MKRFPLKKINKIIEEYKPVMYLKEAIEQLPSSEKLHRVYLISTYEIELLCEEFRKEIITLCKIPKDTTVSLGIENGFCVDYWTDPIYDFWFGSITQEEFLVVFKNRLLELPSGGEQ